MNNNKTLTFYEYPLREKTTPKYLMILLHGYGSNGEDLISLAPDFAEQIPNIHFISPDAPFRFEGGFSGYQWYSLVDRSTEKMLEGANKALPVLNNFIDDQLNRFQLDESKLILCGFSQGAMMGIYSALKRANPCAGVISFSGFVLDDHNLGSEIKSPTQVFLSHGQQDRIVIFDTFTKTKERLESFHIPITSHISPTLGHGIDFACLKAAKEFLAKQLQNK